MLQARRPSWVPREHRPATANAPGTGGGKPPGHETGQALENNRSRQTGHAKPTHRATLATIANPGVRHRVTAHRVAVRHGERRGEDTACLATFATAVARLLATALANGRPDGEDKTPP